MTVERLTRAHLSGVAALEARCFSEPWSERALELLLGDEAVGFAVTDGATVSAYGGMLIAPFEGQITNIAVHPDCRRRGCGRLVLDALLAHADALGLEQVALEVRASNAAAIALYEGAGFAVAGRRKNFYRAPAEDALVMLKPLG